MLYQILKILSIFIPLLISVAYVTLFERKVMGAIQRRRGPNFVGFWGILQPFADGLKLFLKENIVPIKGNKYIFFFSPVLFLTLALGNWGIIPLKENAVISDLHLGVLYVLALSSLSVYGLILAGWSSNSQYAFLGALRSAAQMISYEISITLIILTVVILTESLNITTIVILQDFVWFAVPLFPAFLMFFVSSLAETSRPPFDLPEAEAELVSGYNLEYSSMGFAFFFIAEYTNIIFMSFLGSLLFLGGWYPPLHYSVCYYIPGICWISMKGLLLVFVFIWIRAAFPRFRYDQLMTLTWRVFLPLSLSFFF